MEIALCDSSSYILGWHYLYWKRLQECTNIQFQCGIVMLPLHFAITSAWATWSIYWPYLGNYMFSTRHIGKQHKMHEVAPIAPNDIHDVAEGINCTGKTLCEDSIQLQCFVFFHFILVLWHELVCRKVGISLRVILAICTLTQFSCKTYLREWFSVWNCDYIVWCSRI